jgi:RNA polymerase sigma-70 factor (ECF subfamily)
MTLKAAMTAGESEKFERQLGALRTELIAHCYRMTGSAHEAEDLVQETYLRAWRSYSGFEGRASLRTWLYRIATNVCLTAIERRSRRPLPAGLGPPSDDPEGPAGVQALEVPWLEPIPTTAAREDAVDPAAVAVSRDGVRLALIAGLQYLSAKQRAVLILRDVLEWPAAEAAQVLGTSTTAVNSMLRRARAQLARVMPAEDQLTEPGDPGQRELLRRYAAAFENADQSALVSLLRQDATLEMPPQPAWFAGAASATRFLTAHVLTSPGRFVLLPTEANGQPAFAIYQREPSGAYEAHGVQVLTITGDRVARIVIFLNPSLFPAFGLPATHDPAATAPPAAAEQDGYRWAFFRKPVQ